MPASLHDRIAALEDAFLHTEGALYALQDFIARSLAISPPAEVQRTLAALNCNAEQLDPDTLGTARIQGYKDQLESLEEEIQHARAAPTSIFSRIRRA